MKFYCLLTRINLQLITTESVQTNHIDPTDAAVSSCSPLDFSRRTAHLAKGYRQEVSEPFLIVDTGKSEKLSALVGCWILTIHMCSLLYIMVLEFSSGK